MRNIISIIIITLCSTFCCAQGDDVYKQLLEKSRQQLFEKQNYDSALFYINKVSVDKELIEREPELAADIEEQKSLANAAMNKTGPTRFHRNNYLNIMLLSRRDVFYEKKAEALEREQKVQTFIIVVTAILCAILLIVSVYYARRFRRRADNKQKIHSCKYYDDCAEEMREQIALLNHRIMTSKEHNIDKQAKLFMLDSVTPLISRINHELHKYGEDHNPARITYVKELLAQIQLYNNLMTDWIRLEQGQLSLHLETFDIDSLLDILRKNNKTFEMSGIEFRVDSCKSLKVKADKTMTLFMINTLADNARKATKAGGKVEISASATDSYVEISVSDTGSGMTEEELSQVFSHTIKHGHGFGLQNCRGIINSYAKLGRQFSCCVLNAESEKGRGSRFFFRLPRVLGLLAFVFGISAFSVAQEESRYPEEIQDLHLRRAADFADSLCYLNYRGNYEEALNYADSAHMEIFDYTTSAPENMLDSTLMNNILVDINNEGAIASQALHRWEDYLTYNSTYEMMFNQLTSNPELEKHCAEKEQHVATLHRVSTALLILLALTAVLSAFTILYLILRRRRMMRYVDQLGLYDLEAQLAILRYEEESLHIGNNILTNGLSAIKHETMYFPARIEQLADTMLQHQQGGEEDNPAVVADLTELADFYHELYSNLLSQLHSQHLSARMHIQAVNLQPICGADITVSADRQMLDYMLSILKRHLKTKQLNLSVQRRNQYVDILISTANLPTPFQDSPAQMFSPSLHNIPYIICRQIIRQMGGTSDHHGCGISISPSKDTIILTLIGR